MNAIRLLFLIFINPISAIPFKAINNYFTSRNVFVLNGFLCDKKDGREFLKYGLGEKMIISVWCGEISKNDFDKIFESRHFRLGTFFDLTCETTKNIYLKVSEKMMLNMTNVILLYSNHSIFSYLENTEINFDTDMAAMFNNKIYDLYKINKKSKLKNKVIGSWDKRNVNIGNKPDRIDLEENEIKAMVVLTNLQLNSTKMEKQLLNLTLDPQFDVLSRFGYTVHKHLESLYNFRTIFNVTNDWGSYRKDLGHFEPGTMFRAIEENQVDLGLTVSRIFSERLDVSLYLPPLKKFRTCFVFKHPSTLADYKAFAMPFTYNAWLCTFFMIILAGITLRFIRKFNINDDPPNDPSFPSSILLIIGTMCQQGFYVDSLRLPTRILTLFIQIASLLVYTYYGAELVGFLLTPSPKTINTLDRLIESPIKMYSENLSYHRGHFIANFSEKATKAYYKRIKGSSPDKDRFINLTKGLEKVQKGDLALYGQDTNMYTLIDRTFSNSDKCALFEIEIILMWISTVIRKKSPYKELTYRGIMIVRESGLLLREDRRWHKQRPACIGQEESTAVKFEATLVAQVIFGFGFIFSLFFYLIEKKISVKNNNIE